MVQEGLENELDDPPLDDGDEDQPDDPIEVALVETFEALATELQSAEAEGIEPDILDDLEAKADQAAEALVTLRESRTRVAAIRKDRKYTGAGSSKGAAPKAKSGSKSGQCFDCLEHGHWAGDSACKKPGANLSGRTPSKAQNVFRPGSRQVRVAEREAETVSHEACVNSHSELESVQELSLIHI